MLKDNILRQIFAAFLLYFATIRYVPEPEIYCETLDFSHAQSMIDILWSVIIVKVDIILLIEVQ